MKAKKLFCFFMLLLYAVGIIGGIGYTAYYGGYPIAAGILVAGWMAYPKAKEYFEILKP